MPKVYAVITYSRISDPEALAAYAKMSGPVVAAMGGRVIARGNPLATLEQGLNMRATIVEWDSLEAAQGIYKSEDYLKATALLGDTVERDIRIIEGLS